MPENRILIIDDEIDVCNFFSRLLSRKGYQVVTATNQQEASRAIETDRFSVAMVDLKLPDTDGLSLLRQIKAAQPSCEVIIMTGFSTVNTAVQAIQFGAYDYVEKPFDDISEIETLVAKAGAHAQQAVSGQPVEEEWAKIAEQVGFFVGQSQSMRRLVSLAYKVASKNISVLIQGSTGSGKEVLARFIHAASGRAEQPFIAVNCGALPENLLESELFGHEKGAFTGASQMRRGIFELAHRGALFLDEIGDASPSIQVKLLRVLETGEFCRIGGEQPLRTDVRIISATNVDLEEAIREKTFREDLYYRLNVVRLQLPPLSERQADIQPLAEFLIRQQSPEKKLHPSALEALKIYSWPGNIRELANVLRRAVALCDEEMITLKHLANRLTAPIPLVAPQEAMTSATGQEQLTPRNAGEDFWRQHSRDEHLLEMSPDELNQLLLSLRGLENRLLTVMRKRGLQTPQNQALRESEAETIRKTLEENRWNVTATAKILGIARNTLHRKIKKYHLHN